MNQLYRQALLKADEIRIDLNIDMFESVNIFDICQKLGVSVRFVDINMEGMYTVHKNGTQPTILLSNQRPLPRRSFTCAHEVGHHVFSHGTKLDDMLNHTADATSNDPNEVLVDAFAGYLLMPVAGIETEFIKRKWSIQEASPMEFFTIASVFGVGYGTLIAHCKANKLIAESKFIALAKNKPGKLLTTLLGKGIENSHFKIIDCYSELSLIDVEECNYIIFPENMQIEGDHLKKISKTGSGDAYMAVKPGIVRVSSTNGNLNAFVRIQKFRYAGLAEYRHLEN